MTMMKSKSESRAETSKPRPALSDESILDSFDPMIEGASFQILAEGIDPVAFSRGSPESEGLEAPQSFESFDLAASLARIPDKLFFRIGDAAELLEVKPYVLRFWETEFPMVRPTKSRSGQRVYRKKDVEMLFLIKHLLYVERFSIEGARKRIRELRSKPAAPHAVQSAARSAAAKSTGATTLPAAVRAQIQSRAPVQPPAAPVVTGFQGDTTRVREWLESAKNLAAADVSKFFRF
jgi:DNA-binding transcriptional MerR regulator